MIVKTHTTSDNRLILTICDDELIGKKYGEGEKQLDLTSDFYKGNKMAEKEIIKLIEKAYIINAVGKNSVGCCLRAGVVNKKNIGVIKGVSYAQMTRF